MAVREAGQAKVPGKSAAAHHGRGHSKNPGTGTVGKSNGVPVGGPIQNRGAQEYERFLASSDPSAKTILNSAIQDMIEAILMLHRRPGEKREFSVDIANPIDVDGDIEEYPVPSFPEWSRRIGEHTISLTAKVKIESGPASPIFHVDMTMTVEPLGHTRFKRCKVHRKFDFTIEEVETAPFGMSYNLQA